jgi:hypothetical protein
MSDASPSAAAARDSPSALMIFARFSRSASACLAMARFMLSSTQDAGQDPGAEGEGDTGQTS